MGEPGSVPAIRRSRLLAASLLLPCLAAVAGPMGPGLGNLAYSQDQLYKSLYTFHAKSAQGSNDKSINVVSMYQGYLLFGYGEDSGNPGGGFAFYDVSDPRAPKLVHSMDVQDLRESHAHGFHMHGGKAYFAAQSIHGVHIYDVTDIRSPILVKDIRIPGIFADDYDHAAWWLNWQAPYIYVARGVDGFSMVDATDPSEAKVMEVLVDGQPRAAFPISKTGNFQIGALFAVGNLLVLTNNRVGDGRGISAVDISDPRSPKLLSANTQAPGCYSMFFNGGQVFCVDGTVGVYDVTPTSIKKVGESAQAGAGGEYVHVQDGFIHMGAEDRYAKLDKVTLKIINNDFQLGGEAQEGFANPLGNLVMVTDDHGIGSSFVPHEANPDRTPPAVNFVSPRDGAVNQAATSRIGVTFTDQILVHTLDATTFTVRPQGGQPLKGRYSSQTNIVNFAPETPLQPNTTYELRIAKGGVQDYMGNPTGQDFTSSFSTGPSVAIGKARGAARGWLALERAAGGRLVFRWSGADRFRGSPVLALLDARGSLVRELPLSPATRGGLEAAWDGLSSRGERLEPGIYFARTGKDGGSRVLKVLLK